MEKGLLMAGCSSSIADFAALGNKACPIVRFAGHFCPNLGQRGSIAGEVEITPLG
jgi:hypothetical protein